MDYQDKNLRYTNAEEYDKRGENSILEKYVLSLWQPFLKEKIKNLSVGKVIVDFGCGTGEYVQAAVAAKKIYAVDVSESMLKVCREKLKNFPQAEIINTPAENFNLSFGVKADLIIAVGVWEYINPRDLYAKIKEITRHGSKIIVVFPNIYNDLNWMRSLGWMKKIALKPGFIKNLFKNDFTLIDSASFGAVSWVPKKLQFLALPVWRFCDFIWSPFQKFLPLGVNVYYLFERK